MFIENTPFIKKMKAHLVQIPYLEHGLAIMEGVLKEAILSGQRVVLAPEYRAVRQNHGLEEVEIVLSDRVTNVDGSARDGSGGSVELGTGVGGLEHVPVRLNKVAHP